MLPNIDALNLADLTKLKARVDAAILKARAKGMAEAKAEILALAAKRGLTLADIFGHAPATGRKVAPKWIDSQTGVTWTGRGRTPRNFDKSRQQALA